MNGFSCFRCSIIGKPILGLSNRRFSIHKPLFSTRQSTGFVSTDIPGKLVAGRLDSTPSHNTLLLLPSGISVSGIETWVRKSADVA